MNTSFHVQTATHPVPATILVVDDHQELRIIASLLLQRSGYRVLTANNGEHAKQIARENPQIDLLLTDIEMPGMTGDQLAEWFRVTRPHMGVVFMSGNPMQRCRLEPCYFVEKPFIRLDALLNTIREALDHQRVVRQAATSAAA